MVYVHADDKSRISLTKAIVDKYGRDFVLVPAKDEILLIPISKDPIKALEEEGKKIPSDISIAEIKRSARDRAMKKVLKKVKSKKG